MSLIAITVGLYFLLSATVVVCICMISSRFSQQAGLVEEWPAQEWAYEKEPAVVKKEISKATRYA